MPANWTVVGVFPGTVVETAVANGLKLTFSRDPEKIRSGRSGVGPDRDREGFTRCGMIHGVGRGHRDRGGLPRRRLGRVDNGNAIGVGA